MPVDDRLGEYIASALLPSLGHAGLPFSLEVPPASGTRTTITLLRAAGMPPLLLRQFKHRSQAVRNCQALRHLESLGLPAPRLVSHDLSRAARILGGRGRAPFTTAETWIEGQRVSSLAGPARRAALTRVAELLARFREVRRSRWGRPARGSLLPYASVTLFDARRMAGAILRRGWLDGDESARLIDRLRLWSGVLHGLGPFSLLHKDANPDNFILRASGDVVPVDLHRLAYGPFPEELVTALHHFCPLDPSEADLFLEAYFTRGAESAAATFHASRPFFECLYFLKKLAARSRRTRVGRSDEKVQRWRRLVLALGPPASAGPRGGAESGPLT